MKVLQIKNGKVIAKFDNYNQASKKTNIDGSSISKCCKGKRNTAGGYEWKEEEEDNKDVTNKERHPLEVIRKKHMSNLVCYKSKYQLRYEAYNKMMEEKPELNAYITWSTLLGIEVMNIAYDGLIESLSYDGIYKMQVKKLANECIKELNKFMLNIHSQCYNGDECVVIEEAEEMSIDIVKLKMSISNYLHKFNLSNNRSVTDIKLCQGMTDLIQSMHDNKNFHMKRYYQNIEFSKFIKPTELSKKINELASFVSLKYNNNIANINLNDDICITNGAKVLDNKINDANTISELMNKIYKYNERGKER